MSRPECEDEDEDEDGVSVTYSPGLDHVGSQQQDGQVLQGGAGPGQVTPAERRLYVQGTFSKLPLDLQPHRTH